MPAKAQPEAQLDALASLHARAFTDERPWTAQEFDALLQNPHSFVCATQHAFALGRAIAGEAELLTIATDPDYIRQGLGRAMLAAFETEARKRAAVTAFLEVSSENDAAIGLYTGTGYRVTATRHAYYSLRNGTRADALIMAKPLA
ncbi:ribosomal protein S18-alanine N-acetyltransferase [Rhodalgimonas zhirmunskyi]|uniref:[Ribosomal protein bS18]-alanine N-acetyltransferase n=1 Tax=Rhodalgimonas zhirmunskyi TaxID=2964767 RepID=A0AAJ1U6U4_9RHOB|nr:ribosomal protein S18-alanine N-acetyltransferase [Rhodoalgimonas zhirmunskyi]MDQ2094675.1 ribosomal protein S18-alanine N-acetyltransferase [Rhodoalgimonas zhirmunskyi]